MRIPDQFAAKVLDSLRSREREVLGLHYFEQFEIAEVASLLDMNPDSVSGHLSKGVKAVSRVVDATPDDARRLLGLMGEVLARRQPKQVFSVAHGDDRAEVGVLVHRQIMGCAVREDHQASDVTRYFVVEIEGKPVTAGGAGHWVLESPLMFGHGVRRHILDAKGIKPAAKFDLESNRYFFPAGFGGAELYFERDFDHAATELPLPPGRTILERMPPPPLDVARRAAFVPDLWPLKVMDIGQYTTASNEAMSSDAEEGLRGEQAE